MYAARPGGTVLSPHRLPLAQRGQGQVRYYWLHFTGSEASGLANSCSLPNARLLTVGHSASLLAQFEGLFHDFILRDRCFIPSAASRLMAICVELSRCTERESAQQGIGTSRFRLLFREASGMSPLESVTAFWLNHARQLLAQTDTPLGEVARAVGYPDQFYFSRIFKEYTGLTPSA